MCRLCKNKAEFVGYEILKEGLETIKSKMAASYETPNTKKSD